MFDVFGAEMPLAVRFFLAFLIVLGLIGVTAWAVRRFGSGRLGSAARGRQPRLAVIDYASVDARRRLVLVRRDNVEHLLMIGGPTDVVVEPNIVRATPAARDVASARPPAAADTLPRVMPLPEAPSNGSWPLQPEPAGPPQPPAPPRRAPRVEPVQEEPRAFRTASAVAGSGAASPAARDTGGARRRSRRPVQLRRRCRATAPPDRPRRPRTARRARPEPRMPAPPVDPEAPSAVDQKPRRNGAAARSGFAQAQVRRRHARPRRFRRLRPCHRHRQRPTPTPPPPPPESVAEAEAAPEPPPPLLPPAPPPLPRTARPAEARPFRPAPKAKEGKAIYDTLEQEMASLLGRPPGKPN